MKALLAGRRYDRPCPRAVRTASAVQPEPLAVQASAEDDEPHPCSLTSRLSPDGLTVPTLRTNVWFARIWIGSVIPADPTQPDPTENVATIVKADPSVSVTLANDAFEHTKWESQPWS